jgi:hypothetical protein
VTGMMRVPRSRGAISGTLLVLLGVWGALIPFVGPYFDYAYTPDNAWDYTTGRLLLEVLPGVGAVLGGLVTLGSANRVVATLGGWLAALSGAWFILGVPLSAIWGSPTVGDPIGGTTRQAVEYVGFFGGLGVVMVFLAAFALGRFAVVGVRESERAQQPVPPEEGVGTAPTAAPVGEQETTGRRLRWHGSKHVGAR